MMKTYIDTGQTFLTLTNWLELAGSDFDPKQLLKSTDRILRALSHLVNANLSADRFADVAAGDQLRFLESVGMLRKLSTSLLATAGLPLPIFGQSGNTPGLCYELISGLHQAQQAVHSLATVPDLRMERAVVALCAEETLRALVRVEPVFDQVGVLPPGAESYLSENLNIGLTGLGPQLPAGLVA